MPPQAKRCYGGHKPATLKRKKRIAAGRDAGYTPSKIRTCAKRGFLPFAGYFSLRRAKNNLQKMEGAKLP